MAQYENIFYSKERGIAYIVFNRPKVLNALNRAVFEELKEILDDLCADKETLAVIVTGQGKAFVAGADIAEMRQYTPAEGREFGLFAQEQLNRLENLPKPVICAINGYALGGGLEVALACDIRIIAAGAKVGQPETALGIFPGFGGAQRLPRLINPGNAKYYIYTAEHISAERAYEMGLVQEVVALEELLPRCQALAEKIIANAPVAVRLAKQAINEGMNMGLRPALQYDAEIFGALFGTEDRINGMEAFLAKRKPEFQNR